MHRLAMLTLTGVILSLAPRANAESSALRLAPALAAAQMDLHEFDYGDTAEGVVAFAKKKDGEGAAEPFPFPAPVHVLGIGLSILLLIIFFFFVKSLFRRSSGTETEQGRQAEGLDE